MINIAKLAVLAASGLIVSASWAGPTEDAIRKAVEPRLGVPIERVTKTEYSGLYEVDSARGLVYTDAAGSFLIANSIILDSKTGANLTEKRIAELGAFKFSDLPFADAVKVVRGDGSRVIATVEDPNCAYCKKLTVELAKLNNVTIYTFLYPILAQDSALKSKAIWCAQNRAQVWVDFMASNKSLPEGGNCDTPIDRNIALARKLRIAGTPAILFQSGERLPGFVTAEQIEQRLAVKK
jgi:thiol:disulfide interchange protein DsbC